MHLLKINKCKILHLEHNLKFCNVSYIIQQSLSEAKTSNQNNCNDFFITVIAMQQSPEMLMRFTFSPEEKNCVNFK